MYQDYTATALSLYCIIIFVIHCYIMVYELSGMFVFERSGNFLGIEESALTRQRGLDCFLLKQCRTVYREQCLGKTDILTEKKCKEKFLS